jgi:DNA repair exonuclease SbcCD nuclease subunit
MPENTTELELTEDQLTLIACELFTSIRQAEDTKKDVEELGVEEELEKEEDVASLDEIEEYIQERKELLEEIDKPYFMLKISAQLPGELLE